MTRDEIIRRLQELRESCFAVVPPGCCAEHRRHNAERFHRSLAELDALRQMLTAINEEREACAKVAEAWGSWVGDGQLVATAIRTRGVKK